MTGDDWVANLDLTLDSSNLPNPLNIADFDYEVIDSFYRMYITNASYGIHVVDTFFDNGAMKMYKD